LWSEAIQESLEETVGDQSASSTGSSRHQARTPHLKA
jgi:hypothetical protein